MTTTFPVGRCGHHLSSCVFAGFPSSRCSRSGRWELTVIPRFRKGSWGHPSLATLEPARGTDPLHSHQRHLSPKSRASCRGTSRSNLSQRVPPSDTVPLATRRSSSNASPASLICVLIRRVPFPNIHHSVISAPFTLCVCFPCLIRTPPRPYPRPA